MKNIFSEEFFDEWEEAQLRPVSAIPTHLPTLNRIMRDDGGGQGIAKTSGWMMVVGGSPGFGKSAFVLNLAESMQRWRVRQRSTECAHTRACCLCQPRDGEHPTSYTALLTAQRYWPKALRERLVLRACVA